MTDFQPDQVSFRDAPGLGMWDDGHHREHLTFVQTFAAQTPAVLIPDHDMLQFLNAGAARKSIMESHYQVHLLIRKQLGFTGVDLAAADLENEGQFYEWLGRHATEHAQIRQALGLT